MGEAARLLRQLKENPPGRSGPWWERNRARLLAALEAARLEVCAYSGQPTCDCKYGLMPGGFEPLVIGDEHTGCPELRDLIRALRPVDPMVIEVDRRSDPAGWLRLQAAIALVPGPLRQDQTTAQMFREMPGDLRELTISTAAEVGSPMSRGGV